MRASVINEINEVINNSKFFDSSDFEIITGQTTSGLQDLDITYRYDPSFKFHTQVPLSIMSSSSNSFYMRFSPGEINTSQDGYAKDRETLISAIKSWIYRVKEEIFAIPANRKMVEQQKDLDSLFEKLGEIEDVAFTREEADKLRNELDQLREQLVEHIKNYTVSQDEQKEKIRNIESDVNALKANLEIMNKPNWARSALSRFHKWSKDPDNRGLLKDGVEVAVKLLGGGDS